MDFIAGLIIGGILGGAIGLYIGACAIYMGARVLEWLRSTIGDTKKYG